MPRQPRLDAPGVLQHVQRHNTRRRGREIEMGLGKALGSSHKFTKLPTSLITEPEGLSLSPSSVSRIVENGENILENQKDVAVKIADMEL